MKKILSLFLLLISFASYAQNDTTQYYNSYDYGWRYQRLKPKLALILPSDTTANKVPGSSAIINGRQYLMGASAWLPISNSADTNSMLLPYLRKSDTASAFGRYFTGGILNASSHPALTGDITTPSGSLVTTLKSIGTPGTYGSVSAVPVFVTDYAGRVTSVTNTAINIVESQVTNLVSDLASKVAKAGDIMSGFLTLNADPTNPLHAATKNYVDQLFVGLSWKKSVRVATDANITLSGTQTIHGYALQVGDRVLVKAQTDQTTNGIYVVAAGAWTRGANENTGPSLVSAAVLIDTTDNVLRSQQWANNNPAITLGTTNITFIQTGGPGSYVAGLGLTLTGNVFAINTSVVPQLGVANTFTGNNTFSGSNIFSSSLYATANTSSVILGNANGSPELVFNSQTGNTTTAYANYDRGLGFHIWQAGFDVNNNYLIRRYVSGTFTDNPISISYSTGNVTFADIPAGVSTNPFLVSNGGVISSLSTAQAQSALGLTTFNWVDISSNQTITGIKTFSNATQFNNSTYFNNGMYAQTGSFTLLDTTALNGFISFYRSISLIKTSRASATQTLLYADTTGGLVLDMYNKNVSAPSRAIFKHINTADRAYTFPDKNGVVAMISDLGTTTAALTFNNAGTGAASGTIFNGSVAQTISYNTIGAPSTTGTNASGTWGISITGTAAGETLATVSGRGATTAIQVNLNGSWSVNNASGAFGYLTSVSGQYKAFIAQTGGVNRWIFGSNSDAETGSNAGSNFLFGRYNDAGTLIDIPLLINRATGNISLSTVTTGIWNAGAVTSSGTGTFNTGLVVGNATTNITQTLYSDAASGDSYINFNADVNATKAQIHAHKNGATGGNLEFSVLNAGILTNTLTISPGAISAGSNSVTGGAASFTTGTFSSSVTATSFITSGGTASQIQARDGSAITAGAGITISGGTISTNTLGKTPTAANGGSSGRTVLGSTIVSYTIGAANTVVRFEWTLKINSISGGGTYGLNVNWTKEDGTAGTIQINSGVAAGNYITITPTIIRCKAGTTISVSDAAVSGTISAINYDVYAYIQDMGF